MTPRSLYIHVPFCARRCAYCDFAVEAVREPPVDEWVAAVAAELAMLARDQRWHAGLTLDTLYIGGGTPSLLGLGAMARLREAIAPYVELSSSLEWTCEANPESFTRELAADWSATGVNRISLGVQTFDAAALRWMGRLHGPDGPAVAIAAARAVGFENVSLDLIFGLPAHLGRDWDADLAAAVELGPEHISLYGLTAEPAAPLGRWVAEGRETLADEDSYAEQYLAAHHALTRAGFDHYEVSNFARHGLQARHNAVYWTGAPYAALGPGAHAFYPPERRWNLRSWAEYRDSIAAGRLPIDGQEWVDAEAGRLEQLWLALRTDQGLLMDDLSAAARGLAESWVEIGLARLAGGRVTLSASGWLVLDPLALTLAEAPDAAWRPTPRIDAGGPLVQISPTPTGGSNDG